MFGVWDLWFVQGLSGWRSVLGFGVCARVEGMAFSVSGLGCGERATQALVLLQTGAGFGV